MPVQMHRLHIGTSGWSYREWKMHFYPADCPQKRWFDYYGIVFKTVELNATFYRRFPEKTYLKWRDRAPPGFLYALKVPRRVSHRRELMEGLPAFRDFCEQAQSLEHHLGPLLLQLGPSIRFDPQSLGRLLDLAPAGLRLAVEWRDPVWDSPETYEVLASSGVAVAKVDSPDQAFRPCPSPSKADLRTQLEYVRLHGRSHWYRHCYSDGELGEIAHWARVQLQGDRKDIFIFFNNTDAGWAPANARRLQQLVEAVEFGTPPGESILSSGP